MSENKVIAGHKQVLVAIRGFMLESQNHRKLRMHVKENVLCILD